MPEGLGLVNMGRPAVQNARFPTMNEWGLLVYQTPKRGDFGVFERLGNYSALESTGEFLTRE